MLTDYWEDEWEQRMVVFSIPIKQSRLRFDKGKIKKCDAHSFKIQIAKEEAKEQLCNKCELLNPWRDKEERLNSEPILRSKLNQLDSWVVLKEMSKEAENILGLNKN